MTAFSATNTLEKNNIEILHLRFSTTTLLTSLFSILFTWTSIGNIPPYSLPLLLKYTIGNLTLLICMVLIVFLAQQYSVLLSPRVQKPYVHIAIAFSKYLKLQNSLEIFLSYISLSIVATSFTIYKSSVVGSNGYTFDSLFSSWDQIIFGRAPWILTHHIWSSPTATIVLDALYHPLFLPMLLGYALAMVTRGKKSLRYTYICTYLISYLVVGMILANFLPSAGPIYDGELYGDGNIYKPLIERMSDINENSHSLSSASARDYLLATHRLGIVNFGGGISAMPSMHIVFTLLWVISSWHLSKWAGLACTAYGFLIWATSIHLGWHYFVDGLISILVVAPIWWLVGRIFGLYGNSCINHRA
jgi:hypothetical protein